MKATFATVAFIGLAAGLVMNRSGTQEAAPPPLYENIGSFQRKVTTSNPMAQRYVNQGLAFLYAFHYREANRAFHRAAALDPACAMAWWGIAAANGPHINDPSVPTENAKQAVDALRKAEAALAVATPVEQALVRAQMKRFADPQPEDRRPLDEAYAETMKKAWKEFPNDADVGALLAEALMDLRPWDLWTPEGKPQPGTEEITGVLEEVMRLDPKHPLGNHLMIHAWEASPTPEKADAAANRLRTLQPGIAHMVHMPSHIDVLRGRWKEAVLSNERAVAADRAFLKDRPVRGLYGMYMSHNYDMLAFAAMMRGDSKRAIGATNEMFERLPAEWLTQYSQVMDPGAMLARPVEVRMRFGMWDDVLAQPRPPINYPVSRAMWHYARGVAYASKKQFAEARKEREAFYSQLKSVPTTGAYAVGPQASILKVAGHTLEGELLFQEGKRAEGLEELRKGVAAEDQVPYMEPPYWLQPVRHALGAALMTDGQHLEAEKVYREDLRRHPENGWALYGLSTSLEKQKRVEEARKVRSRFETAWQDADTPLTSSCHCLPGEKK